MFHDWTKGHRGRGKAERGGATTGHWDAALFPPPVCQSGQGMGRVGGGQRWGGRGKWA